MRYLSVCSGIEAATVAWHPLGFQPLAFSEIDPFARAVLAHHYPDVPIHGDFTALRDQPWIVDADILVGGTPCFTAGHLVLTESGYRPIDELKRGDKVMTHLGRLQKIVRVGSKTARVGKLRAVGMAEPLTVTPDHPLLSIDWSMQNTRRGNEYVRIERCGEPEWTAAEQMPGKQWCALTTYAPQSTTINSRGFSVREAMYIAGMYLGDGHIRRFDGSNKKALVLSLNGAKLAKLASVVEEADYTITHERTSVRATFYDTAFCDWLLENFGHYSHLKRLPSWALSHPYRGDLLRGYLDTDGCESHNRYSISSTSKALAYGIADLLNAEGFAASITLVETPETCEIEGRTVNQRDWYQIRAVDRSVSRKSRVRHGYLCRTVQSYEETGDEMVFNIEVDEDHSYVVNGAVVHNCQAFSVAGLRNSLADERGNLSLEFVRLADAIDALRLAAGRPPAIIVWENVPGVLSVRDNAYGCFLAALAGDAAPYDPPRRKWSDAGVVDGPARTVAWRVMDAQYFGLAQRRRRVFVVASAREGLDPAEVLLEFEGVRRDSAPRRETRQDPAACPQSGPDERRSHWDGVEHPHPTLNQSFNTGAIGYSNQELFSQRGAGLVGEASTGDVSHCLNAGGMGRQDYETETLVTHALRGEGFDGGEDGTGRGTPLVPVAFSAKDHGADATEDLSPTLRAMPHHESHANGGGQMAVAIPLQEIGKRTGISTGDPRAGIGIGEIGDPMFTLQAGAQHGVAYPLDLRNARRDPEKRDQQNRQGLGLGEDGDPSPTISTAFVPGVAAYAFQPRIARNGRGDMGNLVNALNAQSGETGKGDAAPCVATTMAVRRLTVVECSRLQGFPDTYLTGVTWRGKCPPPDGPMYKALGNSMAVPCMRWIGQRIVREIGAQIHE